MLCAVQLSRSEQSFEQSFSHQEQHWNARINPLDQRKQQKAWSPDQSSSSRLTKSTARPLQGTDLVSTCAAEKWRRAKELTLHNVLLNEFLDLGTVRESLRELVL